MANLRANNLTGTGGRNAIDGSVFFEGHTSYLSMASGAMISGTGFGTNDFTIEFWMNQGVNAGDYTGIFNCKSSSTTHRFQVAFKDSKIHVYTDTNTWRDTGYIPTAGVYEHIAFQRDYSGNTLKMYANGEEKWSVSNNRDYNEVFDYVYIGDHGTAYDNYQGYLSNLRVCTHLVYASNYFTPPTQKLGLHSETVLLCCQDSDDPTQEATGKTITAHGGLVKIASELTAGELTSSNYSSAGSDWSFSNGVATVSMSSGGYESLGSITNPLINGQLYELVVNVTTFNAGKITFGQANAGNADFTIALGRNVFRHVYSGTTQDTGGISIYARDATGGGYAINLFSLKQVISGKAPKVLPPYGIDEGVVFDGDIKINSPGVMYFPTGDTSQRSRGRAVIGWANNPVNTGMDYFSIQSMGNSISFGTLTSGNRWGSHALSSSTRGLFVGGYINTPASTFFNNIDYVTIATTGNPIDFGDVTTASYRSGCCSSSTRGIIALGFVAPAFGIVNTIDLVTIATLGNATNFGDLFQTRANMSSLSSPTRGVFAGGVTPSNVSTIDYVTIATAANAQDFGDLQAVSSSPMAMASTTRGIIGGGYPTPANTNIIDFITIASTGDATDFGDLTGLYSVGSATSNSIRGVFCGGYTSPSKHNLMEFVTIATTGNASDFGDMLYSRRDFGACSDSHGGLS